MMSDVRQAWRMIGRMPGLAAVAIVSLGVGIGVNTAVFFCADFEKWIAEEIASMSGCVDRLMAASGLAFSDGLALRAREQWPDDRDRAETR